jgi:Integrase core domain
MVVYHPTRRFEMVAIDVMEISPKSARGNSKLVAIGDTFSRYAWAFPVPDEKLDTIAKVLLDGWILRYGPPEKLLSDRGKVFIGKLLLQICDFMGVKKIFTASYHPQCDGFVERMNRTLGKDLASFVTSEEDWDQRLAMACFRYNTSVQEATGITPFKAMYGVDAFDFDSEIGWNEMLDDHRDAKDLAERLQSLHNEQYRRGMNARSAAAKHYDKGLKAVQYKEGDRVLLFHPPALVEQGRKLRSPWLGPYRIQENLGKVGYALKAEQSGEIARVHVNRLRKYAESFKEIGSPQNGVFPDSRRLALRVKKDRVVEGRREFQLVSPGRTCVVWRSEIDLPEVVVKIYDLAKEDKERLR